jgi:hypothetical protein
VRVLACVLVAIASCSSAAAGPRPTCPPGGGTIEFTRAGTVRALSLPSCMERVAGKAAGLAPLAGVRTSGTRATTQRIWVHGRLVFSQTENGPVIPIKLSGDGRWLFFAIDPFASVAADGLDLLVVSTRGGAVHHLGVTLGYRDYLAWCGGQLVYAAGPDRIAIHGKRLLVASPPNWRPRPLWNDPARSFASPSCEPGGTAVGVLTQHTSTNARFFATRWRLWRVRLDGTRRVLDVPPPGWADEQPTWSPDGTSIAFVRERNGYGRLMARHGGKLYGPLAQLGYQLGYYGHHDWGLSWAR